MPEIATSSRDIAAEFTDWMGRSITVDDEITLPAVRRMAAMLDLDPMAFAHGSVIPPHWYSMFFTPNARCSEIGHDGHPRKGDFLPPIPLPRRMFVGRKVTFPGALHVGDRAQKRSEIVGISQKQGRSGTLVFLAVCHTIEVAGKPVIVEQQEVVYRDAPSGETSAATPAAAPANAAWSASYEMDPVLVFRYSALTWNGHRIHYDADYARREEGYPGCVMNGALTLHLVIEEALARAGGRRLAGLSARLVKPLFVGGTLTVAGGSPDTATVDAWAGDEQGVLAATCTLQFEDA
ncbi:MaoC family dehydratase N-terminal domain-containing protein [Pantoea sp. 18069]|uniref:FAS1-like dehydratase domain-containing protein n=1 Tax=Pantoea sp. 18069 TaxID=2681415 RepID=UPI0013599FC0|nr:MaoC family dehydratase N-terminal domain-containing protein [Pantoea sp. 18069]